MTRLSKRLRARSNSVSGRMSLLGSRLRSEYLMKLDEDNRATKWIGESVAWGDSRAGGAKEAERPFPAWELGDGFCMEKGGLMSSKE